MDSLFYTASGQQFGAGLVMITAISGVDHATAIKVAELLKTFGLVGQVIRRGVGGGKQGWKVDYQRPGILSTARIEEVRVAPEFSYYRIVYGSDALFHAATRAECETELGRRRVQKPKPDRVTLRTLCSSFAALIS